MSRSPFDIFAGGDDGNVSWRSDRDAHREPYRAPRIATAEDKAERSLMLHIAPANDEVSETEAALDILRGAELL